MSYHEYLDIDRKTVTKEQTPTTVAKRYVYVSSEVEQAEYVGKWRPVEQSKVVYGVIVHDSEAEADDSDILRSMCLGRIGERIDGAKKRISQETAKALGAAREIARLQLRLHRDEETLRKVTAAKSLRDMLRARVQGKGL